MGPVAVVVDQVAAVVVRISKYFLGNKYAQCLTYSHTLVDLSHVKKKIKSFIIQYHESDESKVPSTCS